MLTAALVMTSSHSEGPVYWYQIFDYAVGHWFQKTAEHVLGSVLCCPGCFSLYRVDALRDVLLEYSSSVTEAYDFLTMDMGEDRWLCTLLVLKGWRLDYTAVAANSTYCPNSFDEFFNQRRRWIVSTLANQVALLQNAKTAVRNNDAISYMFIFYQCLMIFASLVTPATTAIVVMGGVEYTVWQGGRDAIMGIMFSVLAVYILTLQFCKQKTQLQFSQILTGATAVIMAVVVISIGTSTSTRNPPHPFMGAPSSSCQRGGATHAIYQRSFSMASTVFISVLTCAPMLILFEPSHKTKKNKSNQKQI